ncbi:non-ribosomal peptide synthetase [Paenibacillus lentus]|uniref:Amino acid adenylation domain-containing protein n=1 Tax=Paenibacillus lentus TaxID=1338368 RepID=A0A3Q8S6X4_9BACL|nr:non-ribosomal peptide synthetase [Paenibacillus lentus]AZK48671.1 amino acid adenylation domain-containing protein [Paenibacillus lentus]
MTSNLLQNVSDVFPMSDIQLGMVFHYMKHEGMYHDQFVYQLDDPLFDTQLWRQAMTYMVTKHQMLRTSFHIQEFSTPVQMVHEQVPIDIEEMDISEIEGDPKQYIYNYLAEERLSPFDVALAPLWRMKIMRLNQQQVAIIWIFHHAILDGWSAASFITELVNVYFALKEGSVPLVPLKSTYKDYVIDQMLVQDESELFDYWKKELAGYKRLELPELATTRSSPDITIHTEEINKTVIEQCKKVARENRVTVKTLCLAAFLAMMYSRSYEEDITVGLVENGRPITEDADKILGCFLNTVPFRISVDPQINWKQLIAQIYQKQVDLKKYGRLTFAKIAESVGESGVDHNPLFDVIFNFVDFHVFENVKEHPLQFWMDGYERTNTLFDFSVSATLDHYIIRVVSVFPEQSVKAMVKHFQSALASIVYQIDMPFDKLTLLDEGERLAIEAFNNTKINYPQVETLHSLFESQVKKRPDSVALTMGDQQLTYHELNERANQLARILRRKGVQPDQVVGLMTERSFDMIVAILAIFKAGGAYMPIDPSYPDERINYMLEDSHAPLLLVQHSGLLRAKLDHAGEILILSEVQAEGESGQNLRPAAKADNLAYVMYTSGSTGQPKGVMTTHRNVVRTVVNNGYLDITPEDRLLQLSNYAFDGSTFDIYGALIHGATLVLVSREEMLDPSKLVHLIRKEGITVTFMTTALFNTLVDLDLEGLERLRKLVFGGEQASVKHVQKALDKLGEGRLVNGYGPTETTVFAATWTVDQSVHVSGIVPIGRPLNNTVIHIVDAAGRLQPIGVAGELCVSGDGVARGYLNRPELTAERFVPNPWEPGTMMYRTGDLARWLPGGTIEYLGRMDQQVKIRGHRIELGEIEAKLLEHPVVRETVLIARQDDQGHSSLCAYIVTDGDWTAAELRRHLASSLPEYMIPSTFTGLPQLPLTSNGKVDKRALPEPEQQLDGVYVAPANELEEQLAALFGEVLGVEVVGTQDSFFEHGGHSLKAMTLAARIHKELGVNVPLQYMFDNPTVQKLSELVSEVRGTGQVNHYLSIEQAEERDYYPTTPQQKQMYILQQMEDEDTASSYHMPLLLEISGELQEKSLRASLDLIIQRHEALRTSFHMIDEKLVQCIHGDVKWSLEDGGQILEQDLEQAMFDFMAPFDLSSAPLFRANLVKLTENQHILMLDMHHIISDGLSVKELFQEIIRSYQGLPLQPLSIQYKDYAVWTQTEEWEERLETQEAHWLNQLSGELPVLELPTDYPRPATRRMTGKLYTFGLPDDLTKQLRTLSAQEHTTLYTVLLAVFNIMLSKYTSQEDIVVGTPIAGRPHADLQHVLGMFVNTLVIRSQPRAQQTFMEYLADVKTTIFSAYENSDYPFEKLVDKLNVARDLSRNPVFDVMFSIEDLPRPVEVEGAAFHMKMFDWKKAKFDMDWTAVEGETIQFMVEYNTSLFQDETVERMAQHYIHLLSQVVECPEFQLWKYNLITPIEKEQILLDFNHSEVPFPKNQLIHERFEEWVKRTPDNNAVVFNNQSLTYHQLNERANSLARSLVNLGIGNNDFVGLLVDRSFEMIIGMLAILKAGGAYLPIDPDYPPERIQYMLEDSGAKLLLKQERLQTPGGFAGNILSLDDQTLYQGNTSNLELAAPSDNLAYIIYTSGSTGKPKGVLINHRSILNMQLMSETFGIRSGSRVLQFASFSFDSSVGEIFYTLLNGASLYLIEKEMLLSAPDFMQWLKTSRITSIPFISPSALRALPYEDLPDLEYISTGGEPLPADLVSIWGRDRKFLNAYGPTETTVDATIGLCTADGRMHIGRPIKNRKAYILNGYNQLQPIGVLGELCLGGEGVAVGYLNRPDLTDEKFVPDPFIAGGRMYKTGDLVRWLPDGTIEYFGRIDQQVKIRGHRIEIGEIEERLLEHPSLKEAIVVADTDHQGSKYLCAYVVLDGSLHHSDIRQYLKTRLPDYMIPSYFVEIHELPLTPNGKINKKALPKPQMQVRQGEDIVAPSDPYQSVLHQIWQEVLGSELFGIHDNFFDLGGDSIKALQISARLGKQGLRLRMRDLFANPTIAELSQYVREHVTEAEQFEVTGSVPLTPIQKWFFEQQLEEPHHYNQSVLLYNENGWDDKRVREAFTAISKHHDALRMRYSSTHGITSQEIQETGENEYFYLEQIDLCGQKDYESRMTMESTRIQGSMNLNKGPLVNIGLFRTDHGDYLLIAIHHLVVDGVSWRILIEDFNYLYEGNTVLPLKTTSYQAWANHLQEYAGGPELAAELPYWEEIARQSQQLSLVSNTISVDRGTYGDMLTYSMKLTAEQTDQLLTQSHQAYRTEINDLLLAALTLALKEWTGGSEFVINLEGHGREEISEQVDVSRTVGWFTSEYPVLFNLTEDGLASTIRHVKNTLRSVPNKGIGYGILKYLAGYPLNIEPEISFNYLGTFDSEDADGSPLMGEPIGLRNSSPMLLDINGIVAEGHLLMRFGCNAALFSTSKMEQLVQYYQDYLVRIIEHCQADLDSGLALEDLTMSDLTLEELNDIFDDLEEERIYK